MPTWDIHQISNLQLFSLRLGVEIHKYGHLIDNGIIRIEWDDERL